MGNKHLLAGLALAAFAGLASATPVAYTVAGLGGSWAWGDTEWNDAGTHGYVNDSTDVGKVNALLNGVYAYAAPGAATPNGIYNWPSNASVIFSTGEAYYNTLTLLSSRSYSPTTQIVVDYSNDHGSTWLTALTTTTGALGWTDIGTGGTATETLNLNLGGVLGNELRFSANGQQISLHTVAIAGSTVPEPGTIGLVGLALAGVGLAARRRRAAD